MYFKYEAERSEINHSGDIYPVVSSTPMKIVENTEESICSPILKTVDNTILEESLRMTPRIMIFLLNLKLQMEVVRKRKQHLRNKIISKNQSILFLKVLLNI